jgi:hypothetical protein
MVSGDRGMEGSDMCADACKNVSRAETREAGTIETMPNALLDEVETAIDAYAKDEKAR